MLPRPWMITGGGAARLPGPQMTLGGGAARLPGPWMTTGLELPGCIFSAWLPRLLHCPK